MAAGNGEQEATLNKECFSIGGLVGAGELDKEATIARLAAAWGVGSGFNAPLRERTAAMSKKRGHRAGIDAADVAYRGP